MFLERRVYQGSSGRVYPLPFTDRIAEQPVQRRWKAVWLENDYLQILILPELGGRIHAVLDKTNHYDLIYRQDVIKPALVGLAGPWISGGIEFNWPQHHRPATFLPVDTAIESHSDGSRTVWCSDHDPLCRMKGMHGVCLHPDRACLELKVRAYNRTPFVQTFLWWANVATRVHEGYQSFFPPDVHAVADHARRATSSYPLCDGVYYGVNYGARARHGVPASERPPQFVPPHCRRSTPNSISAQSTPRYAPNDLSWYANIPTPCSYMALGSRQDFFGGYDHHAQAGLIHIANHHVSPGKKQWTWGNHPFGYAWDRNLTDGDAAGAHAPYIELMAGVYTDNQPDFSFLQPGETKSWNQHWWPLHRIGPAHHANIDAAINLTRTGGSLQLGICVSRPFPNATVELGSDNARHTRSWRRVNLRPGRPFIVTHRPGRPHQNRRSTVRVIDANGHVVIEYSSRPTAPDRRFAPATEPPTPNRISSADELYLTGLHLHQYRHATRCPTVYWREALRRDPLDARCNTALGNWHLRRGEFNDAESCFRRALQRLTRRNPNPYDGEAAYGLGLCLRFQLLDLPNAEAARRDPRFTEAYASFYKAAWNQAWASSAYHALAEMDGQLGQWTSVLDHLDRSLRLNTDNLRARDLRAVALLKLGRRSEARSCLRATLALDPLDWWARHLLQLPVTRSAQVRLDLAHDFVRAGLHTEAVDLLRHASAASSELPDHDRGALPLVHYTQGFIAEQLGRTAEARAHRKRASVAAPDYCFPARLEELPILESAMRANPKDPRAPYYLGNLLYDRQRHAEAVALWQRSTRLDPTNAVAWRNLGIGYFNISHQPSRARAAYDRALRANPSDARLLFERDQLGKRLGESPTRRLRILHRRLDLVRQRDDLSVELCALYNQIGSHQEALRWLERRHFQPWEGGEGLALGQHVRTHLALGRRALDNLNPTAALQHFRLALGSPHRLGEARHLLANPSDIHYWIGVASSALGDQTTARRSWETAAAIRGDFQGMRVQEFSEMTYYVALAQKRLGRTAAAQKLLKQLLKHALTLEATPARIDYFATSLPTMLLFTEDLDHRQQTSALFLQAQARLGLDQVAAARRLLRRVLRRDPNHAHAADLWSTGDHD